MSKKILECGYCGSIITENDTTCPKCGANCSSIIKEYKKEQAEEKEKQEKEIKDKMNQVVNDISKGFNTKMKFVPFFIMGVAFIIFITIIVFGLSMVGTFKKTHKETISGTVNEKIEKETYTLTIDSYESFEYFDDFFKNCNTREGYQKVAFHFIIENISDDTILTSNIVNNIVLKAEDEEVLQTKIEADTNFCEVIQGKQSYNKLSTTSLISKDKVSGYLGYQVPKDKQKLKFIVEDNLVIEMDNPFYEEEEKKK